MWTKADDEEALKGDPRMQSFWQLMCKLPFLLTPILIMLKCTLNTSAIAVTIQCRGFRVGGVHHRQVCPDTILYGKYTPCNAGCNLKYILHVRGVRREVGVGGVSKNSAPFSQYGWGNLRLSRVRT